MMGLMDHVEEWQYYIYPISRLISRYNMPLEVKQKAKNLTRQMNHQEKQPNNITKLFLGIQEN